MSEPEPPIAARHTRASDTPDTLNFKHIFNMCMQLSWQSRVS